MKLELKHLAPYLPYELKLKCTVSEHPLDDNILTGIQNIENDFYQASDSNQLLSHYKPILRPLTDLINKISINDESFVPLEKCCLDYTTEIDFIENEVAYWQSHEHTHLAEYTYQIKAFPTDDGDITLIEEFSKDGSYKTQLLNYDRFFQLIEWHFDVFGLIEKGLAIDINSINN